MSKWLMAMFILCSSKKSVSAHQMHRMIGVTYKTAWFLCHRIRYAMGSDANTPKLDGVVEADETFVGGKGDQRTVSQRKTPVVALIQRDGPMRTAVVSNVTQKNLNKVIGECVAKSAVVHTDEHAAYVPALKDHKKHETVVHSKYEYARRNADGTVTHIFIPKHQITSGFWKKAQRLCCRWIKSRVTICNRCCPSGSLKIARP